VEFDPGELDDSPKSSTRIVFDSAMHRDQWREAEWNGYHLPGSGRKLISCGKLGFKICDNTAAHEAGQTFVRVFRKSCCRSQCPLCVEDWANRDANAATRRLWRFHEQMMSGSMVRLTFPRGRYSAKEKKRVISDIKFEIGVMKHPNGRWDSTSLRGPTYFFTPSRVDASRFNDIHRKYGVVVEREFSGRMCNASHVVMSVPDSMHGLSVKEIKSRLADVKKDVGIVGSMDILHPFRFDKRNDMRPYASPHVHMIAFGWIQNVKESFERHGIIVKKISTLQKEYDYFNTCKYLLSHCGVRDSKHAVVYTGAVSYSKLSMPKKDDEGESCPHCGEKLKLGRIPDDKLPFLTGIPPPFDGPGDYLTFFPLEEADFYTETFYDPDNYWQAIGQIDIKEDRLEGKLERPGLPRAEREFLQNKLDLIRAKKADVDGDLSDEYKAKKREIDRKRSENQSIFD